MFERYNEKARRTIFFARYEASQTASRAIEPEHLVLGLLREDRALFKALPASEEKLARLLRDELTDQAGDEPPLPSSIDMPLSQSAKRSLAFAAEESERLGHHSIGTEHLLLGVIKTEGTFAAETLSRQGITAERVIAYANQKRGKAADSSAAPDASTGGLAAGGGGGGGRAGGTIGGLSGHMSFEEFFGAVADKAGMRELKESFILMLELLVRKGTITPEEKAEIEARLK